MHQGAAVNERQAPAGAVATMLMTPPQSGACVRRGLRRGAPTRHYPGSQEPLFFPFHHQSASRGGDAAQQRNHQRPSYHHISWPSRGVLISTATGAPGGGSAQGQNVPPSTGRRQ